MKMDSVKQSMRKDAVVIGAGISGLATAFRLHEAGLDVLVLEKSDRVGGAIRTERWEDFLVDFGPNSTLDTSPEIGEFLQAVGVHHQRIDANAAANRRYILRDAQLRALPMNPPQFLTSKLFSLSAKLRLLREPFVAPAPPNREETIAEFVERRLGREFLDYAINPFIAGVYAGDPRALSVRSAVAKIYALEKNYGSLIKGAIKGAKARKRRGETDKTRAKLFSFRNGMAQLSEAIQAELRACIETGAELQDLRLANLPGELHAVRYLQAGRLHAVETRALVFTTPAYVTAELLRTFDAELAEALLGMRYAPVAVVFFGYRRNPGGRPLDGFGFLVPEVERRRILGSIWSSTIFPGRAPAGGAALTTFVGGMRQPDLVNLEDDDLAGLVRDELSEIMGLTTKPDVVRIQRWRRAIPQYELGHQKRLDAVSRFETEHPGVFVSGNFRYGISVGDCILQSRKVADAVTRQGRDSRTVPLATENSLT